MGGDEVIVDKPVPGAQARSHPGGKRGSTIGLEEVAKRAWAARMSPRLRAWATQTLDKCGRPTGIRAKVQCLLDEFRRKVPYVSDPVMGEAMYHPEQTLCLDDAQGLCIVGHDCFPRGTLLLRDDYELVPVEEIKTGDRIWGHNAWTVVKNKWFKGILETDTLVLNNGSHVPLTRDHHVYVGLCDRHADRVTTKPCSCPWEERRVVRIPVSDVEPGMMLPRPKQIPFGNADADPDLKYIEGLYCSEGWIQKNTFCISGCDGFRKESLKHEVKAICDRVGIPTHWSRKYIAVKDAEWTSRMMALGHRARFKRVETMNLSEAPAAALLRGVMSDSTANTWGDGRTFSSTSTLLMTQARVLQRMFGRDTGVRYMTPEEHGGAGEHSMWRMQVWGKSEKTPKLLRVRDVERDTGEAPCYDITTEDGFVYLPQHDVTVSNCDDGAITMAAAVMSIGISAMIVGASYHAPADTASHVYFAFKDDIGDWVEADTTTTTPVGTTAPALQKFWIDPAKDAVDRGLGDFIGVGGATTSGTLSGAPEPEAPADLWYAARFR